MKRSREEILLTLKETLAQRPEILFAYLFGSFVEEEKFRDLDVDVYVHEAVAVPDSFEYAVRLAGELGLKMGYPVDVILMNTAPDHLIYSISKGTVLVDRDEDFRVDWLINAWNRYFDIQPKRRQAIVDMLN
ncbi:MAG: hypothetical protein C4326_02910 [Ignavibacteria bacterium]